MKPVAGLGVAFVLLAGCAHYDPKPIAPAAFPSTLAARTLAPRAVWSGDELLTAALDASPAVAEAEARYRTALAAARASRVRPLGTLTLTAEYSKEAGGSSPWLLGGLTDIPLDRGNLRGARLATADLQALQALYDYAEAVWSVRTALARARVERTEAEAAIIAAERLAGLRRARLERLQQRIAAGEDARGVSLIADTERLTAEARLADARARRDQADAGLAQALTVPPSAVRDLVLAPAEPPPPLTALADWRTDAALSRRDVLRAVADYDLAEAALRLEVARQRPQVSLGPGYTWERGVTKLPFNLALALPPSDLNRAGIAQAEAKRADAGRSLERVQADVLFGVDKADAALASATTNLQRAETQDLPAARRIEASTATALRAGDADRVDQLGAEAQLAEAELNALDARRARALAAVDLEDALRRPFAPEEAKLLQDRIQAIGGAR